MGKGFRRRLEDAERAAGGSGRRRVFYRNDWRPDAPDPAEVERQIAEAEAAGDDVWIIEYTADWRGAGDGENCHSNNLSHG